MPSSDFLAGVIVCASLFLWRMHKRGEIASWDADGRRNPAWLTIPFFIVFAPVLILASLIAGEDG